MDFKKDYKFNAIQILLSVKSWAETKKVYKLLLLALNSTNFFWSKKATTVETVLLDFILH